MSKYLLTLALALLVASVTCEGQYSKRKNTPWILKGLSTDVKLGATIFFGDIMDEGNVKFGGEITARKEVLPFLTVRADLGGGIIGGKSYKWDGTFKTTLGFFDFGAEFKFLNLSGHYFEKRLVDPYVGAGFGVLLFKPNNESPYAQHISQLQNAINLGDWNDFTQAPMPWAVLGARYYINEHWAVRGEFKGMVPIGSYSDRLDGHDSGASEKATYDENGNFVDGILLGSNKYDVVYLASVGVSYTFARSEFRMSSKYNRKVYMNNKKIYNRNAKRARRR